MIPVGEAISQEAGAVKVAVTVALMQYGAQWRAILPSGIEARIDDLQEALRNVAGASSGVQAASVIRTTATGGGISEMLTRARRLSPRTLPGYYDQFMRRIPRHLAQRRKTLINACSNNEDTRDHDHDAAHRGRAAAAAN